jgi:hypothetical protein
MPAHSSHLLQPLNVSCFSPLKRAYSREVKSLIRHHINHITKLEFLPAFKTAYDRSFTSANICSAFRGAGLVPLQPDTVLSKLNVQLRTPTPATLPEAPWEARTPSNVRELDTQSTLIRERVRRHKSSSPASIIEAINQLKKGAKVMMLSAKLMRDRITSLKRANEAASARKQRKKKRIQRHGVLTKGAGEDLLAQREANQQIAREERREGQRSGVSRQALARCTKCRETRHNSRTCKKDSYILLNLLYQFLYIILLRCWDIRSNRCAKLVGWPTRLPGRLAYPTGYRIFEYLLTCSSISSIAHINIQPTRSLNHTHKCN